MTLILRLTLLAAAVTIASTACLSSDWKQFQDMCYWRSDNNATWSDAASFCGSQFPGSDLVSIHDLNMDAFIGEQVLDESQAWIGLHRTGESGDWTWSDGTPYDFTMWYENTPDWQGGCATINWATMGWWVGYGCESQFYFMCQIAAS